ncbi:MULTISPECIES: ABC transporter permease [Bacillaceae]|uniref:ABC transporter permease n=1 Tax=Bacillaceae TaxID=186817 RepID=UPI001BDE85E1|nr:MULTISPECIES: ABC transporter permease [Bacillaceae]MDX8360817.1 ABC transporter permease [Cytobacillus sp. IB215316]
MIFSLKRVNAIFIKDWIDLLKNSYMLLTIAMPLVLAAYFGRVGSNDGISQMFIINLTFTLVGTFVQASIVAEEKEKNTLRGLLLSPASTLEILVGKSTLSAAATMVVVAGVMFLSDFQMVSLPLFILMLIVGLIIYISVGTMIGLLSRTVMETGVVGMPILVILGMGSIFTSVTDNELIIKLVSYLPSEQFNYMWTQFNDTGSYSDIFGNLFILLIWVVVAIAVTLITYKKRRFD